MGFVNLINQPNWAVTLKMHLFGFVSSCCDTYFLITVAADSSYQLLLSKRVLKPLQQQPNLTQLIPSQPVVARAAPTGCASFLHISVLVAITQSPLLYVTILQSVAMAISGSS